MGKGGPNRGVKTAQIAIRTAERRDQIIELRRDGLSFKQCAKVLGISRQACTKLFDNALVEIYREGAEAAREVELQRLDKMHAGLVRAGAYDGDPKAVLAAVRVSERRSKLTPGLDVPTRTEVSGPNGAPIPIADARAMLAAKLDAIADNIAGDAPGLADEGSAPGSDPEPEPGGG